MIFPFNRFQVRFYLRSIDQVKAAFFIHYDLNYSQILLFVNRFQFGLINRLKPLPEVAVYFGNGFCPTHGRAGASIQNLRFERVKARPSAQLITLVFDLASIQGIQRSFLEGIKCIINCFAFKGDNRRISSFIVNIIN